MTDETVGHLGGVIMSLRRDLPRAGPGKLRLTSNDLPEDEPHFAPQLR